MVAAPWPSGEDAWVAFAAALAARMARLQVHVEPDWLFAVCTVCGWDIESSRPDVGRFRFEVASHECPVLPVVVPAVSVDFEDVLF